ncbi:MAG: hypothetical protein ACWGQW_03395 [bacterium]
MKKMEAKKLAKSRIPGNWKITSWSVYTHCGWNLNFTIDGWFNAEISVETDIGGEEDIGEWSLRSEFGSHGLEFQSSSHDTLDEALEALVARMRYFADSLMWPKQ